jgi:hypothetical protein
LTAQFSGGNGKNADKTKKVKGDGDMSKRQLYSSPVVLNSVTHKDLKVAPISNFNFAKGFNSCVILGQEFLEAAKYYPIVFSKTDDTLTPVIVLGISENQFVNKEGKWQEATYVPAFIRRYPYILAEGLSQDGSLTVCIDADYEGFNKPEGERLFDDEGQKTASLTKAVEFLTLYQTQYEVTKAFINAIKDLDIFKAVDANITLASGKTFTIRNLSMVDEAAMLKLPDDKLIGLVRSGYLAWIYAHLYSLTNFSKIMSSEG